MDRLLRWTKGFVRELRRRRVIRVAVVYASIAFVILQLGEILVEPFGLGDWTLRLITLLLMLGFPLAVGLAWVYNITEEGLVRDVGQEAAMDDAEVLRARTPPWTALALVAVVTVTSAGIGWAAWDLWLATGSEGRAAVGGGEDVRSEASLSPTRVAVLPFEDGSRGGSLERVARGLSRDLSHQLSQLDALDVVSDLGTRAFAGSDLAVDSIARALNAGSLVTGSVESVGDRVRVRVQLVDGQTGESLMSSEFARHRDSVLVLRHDLVEGAVRQLRRQLGEEIELDRTRGSTSNVQAWELYHQAETIVQRADSLRRSGASELAGRFYERADSLYRGARRADDDWLAPRIARGWLAFRRARLGEARIAEANPEWLWNGVEIADRVLADRPRNAAALELRGVLRSWLCQVGAVDSIPALRQRAEEDLQAAVTQEPDRARAWAELAEVHRAQGDFQEARTAWNQARKADAFLSNNAEILQLGSHLALELGEPEMALEWAKKGQRRYPESPTFPQFQLLAYPMNGAPRVPADSVWAVLREFEGRMGGRQPYARVWVAATLARLGLADSARSVLDRALARSGEKNRLFVAYYEPKVWLNLGDTTRAVHKLQQMINRYDYWRKRRDYIKRDSWWEPLHGDSTFRALVAGGE